MSRPVLPLLVLASALGAGSHAAKGMSRGDVAFARAAPKPGEKLTLTSEGRTALTIVAKIGGKEENKSEIESSRSIALTCTVASADANAITAAKLDLQKCAEVHKSPLGDMTQELPCSNKSYRIERKGGDVAVLGADGKAADEEESASVKNLLGLALDHAPLAAVLAGRTLKVGDSIDVPVEAAIKLLGPFAENASVKSLKLTLAGARAEGGVDCALFRMNATFAMASSPESPGDLSMELAGDLLVSKADCTAMTATAEGPVKLAGKQDLGGGQAIELAGTGKASWKLGVKRE